MNILQLSSENLYYIPNFKTSSSFIKWLKTIVLNTPKAHTWLLNFPIHSESDRIWKLPVILRKWTCSHLWRWAMRHLSWQTCPQGSSWYLLHPCIQKDGREGKDSDTLIQVTMLGYSLFSTIVFKMYLR